MSTRFKDRAYKASRERPCPICGRPSGDDPRSAGKCLISKAGEHTNAEGFVYDNPEAAQVFCFRVSAPRVGPYVLQEQQGDRQREGAFYVDEDAGELIRLPDGSAPKAGSRGGKRPRKKKATKPAAPVWVNRLEQPPAPPRLSAGERKMRRKAVDIWENGTTFGHAMHYLASRGIDRDWIYNNWPSSLRWCTSVYHKDTDSHLSAMLGRVVAPTGEHVATHRVYLKPDGRGKAGVEPNKVTLGPLSGGSIRLYDPRDDAGTLCIAEGIETAMAVARAVVGLGWGVWSCLSTGGMRALLLPSDMVISGRINRVVVLADVDRSRLRASPADPDGPMRQQGLGGQRAARATAERLRNEYPGLAAVVAWPGEGRLIEFDEVLGECVPGRVI